MSTEKKDVLQTVLFHEHERLGAVMTDFSGWQLPVYYTSIIKEHLSTRKAAGVFDISHMGEILVTGGRAREFLQYMMTNDLERLKPGRCFYSAMCNEQGGTVDDCFIYMFDVERFWIIVNAANIQKDFAWLQTHAGEYHIAIHDLSSRLSKIDVQGPLSADLLQRLTAHDLNRVNRFDVFTAPVADRNCTLSRSGYTAEDGFEIYCDNRDAAIIWNALLTEETRAVPVGLGARDTLRIEACYSLYGHELNDTTSPVEAGIGWVVREKESAYIGKDILLTQKKQGTQRILVAFRMIDKGIPRAGYPLFCEGKECGTVSSGCYAPTLGLPVGLGFVPVKLAAADTIVQVKIRERLYNAQVVQKPFYQYKGVM